MLINKGKIEKMIIYAYKETSYADKDKVGSFSVLINPENYTHKFKTEYCETQGAGSTGVAMKYSKMLPQEISFDFLFDGTGVVKDASLVSIAIPNPFDESKDVNNQIDTFKKTVSDFQGDVHRPYFLKIVWGTFLFKCVLVSMDIEYKLFNPEGKPVRAVAKCAFKGSLEDEFRVAKDHLQSPDITHERIFRAEDMLPLMTNNIYNNQQYYIDVARTNNLDSFRNIEPGTLLYFIPLQK